GFLCNGSQERPQFLHTRKLRRGFHELVQIGTLNGERTKDIHKQVFFPGVMAIQCFFGSYPGSRKNSIGTGSLKTMLEKKPSGGISYLRACLLSSYRAC